MSTKENEKMSIRMCHGLDQGRQAQISFLSSETEKLYANKKEKRNIWLRMPMYVFMSVIYENYETLAFAQLNMVNINE